MFVRYLIKGKPCTSFVKIIDLSDLTAEIVERALLDVCWQCAIPTSEMFGLGSDGAPIMR